MKKTMIILISVVLAFFLYALVDSIVLTYSTNTLKSNASTYEEIKLEDLINSSREDYYYYILEHEDKVFPDEQVNIDIENISEYSGVEPEVLTNYNGVSKSLLTAEVGDVTWEFNVPEEGLYNILVDYFPYEGRSASIERSVEINGVIPFEGARTVVLPRIWGNESEIKQDIYGNDIRPTQIEKPRWTSTYLKDSVGYVSGNYQFYFKEGINELTLIAEREPLLISAITLMPIVEIPTYEQVKEDYSSLGYKKVDNTNVLIESENSSYSTSPTLYPLNSTDPATSPNNSPTKMKLNTIGGTNWGISGDSIAWNFKVEETGLYEISLRVKQNLASGMASGRTIYINDEIRFKELENYSFVHNTGWRNQTLGTNEEPFYFYFEEGIDYELRLEASMGQYGSRIAKIESSINNLSRLYREIIRMTSVEPDPNRDYPLLDIPNFMETLETELSNLENVREDLIELSGTKSEKTGILDTMIYQLRDFVKKPLDVHKKIRAFNDNISSLGTLVIMLSSHPIELDYILVHSADTKLPKARTGVLTSLWYGFRSFMSTFTTDYSSIGMTINDPNAETIEVWITVGKDQTNILRKLIDEQFSSTFGIQVDLKLVSSAALLPATLSGNGPDVALGVGYNVPVNYALRNAAYDLTKFDDYNSVETRFHDSAIVPFSFGDSVFALPEQQMFLMMFYRKDIFEEYGLEVPNTWDDLISSVIDLQKYNLEFYLPVPISEGGVVNLPPNPIFSTMFYQNDGEFYVNNDRESGFDTGMGSEIFERWTQFYTDYSFPVSANFVNRFRSGQMPIGITYYNTYNTLSVFAPEIRGKWGFLPVPGTVVTDGEGNPVLDEQGELQIRRETVSTVTGSMILSQTKKEEASWEFLKWWTSTETQTRFGREMEGILGAAARYPTANMEAMKSLPWRANEIELLQEQWNWVRGIPEVPGSYMTGRHLDNAFRLVINEDANPRETIYDYVQTINEEIAKKREEFGLD